MSSRFVTEIDPGLGEKLKKELSEKGLTLSQPDHTVFCAKQPGLSCTLYKSGKLVVQGKADKLQEFVQFYLEPEVFGDLRFTHPHADIDRTPRIGSDEAGKGDYFGPLCIASVYVDEKAIDALLDLRVADSKTLSDARAGKLATQIRSLCPHHIIALMPAKYNELYSRFGNLNHLLAWAHVAALESVHEKTGCRRALVDQFATPSLLEGFVARKKLDMEVAQRVRAESDIAVAAASILARDAFLRGLKQLGDRIGIELPKGAGPRIIQVGRRIVAEKGESVLQEVSKTHFRTNDEILG